MIEHSSPVGQRVVVIVNPMTKGNVDRIVRMLRATAPRNLELEIHRTEYARHGGELAHALRDRAAIMVAVGGDGTVSEVAGAIRGTDTLLGIIPGGSTNIIARELGIPAQADRAVALLFGEHAVRPLDVGLCGDHAFLHMAGAGFDSEFLDLTSSDLKRRIGWVAYLPAAVAALRTLPVHYTIRTPDTELEVLSPLVLVANGGSIIHPRFKLHSGIRKDDGMLDVFVITATTPVELARVLGRLATMSLERSPYVIHLKTTEVSLSATSSVPVELDGDVVARTPATFVLAPAAIRVISPLALPV
jgi:YegS/Rv2252/BmrU family lipid kinase